MKKILILPLLLIMFIGCATTEKVTYLEEKIDDLNERIRQLEEQAGKNGTDITEIKFYISKLLNSPEQSNNIEQPNSPNLQKKSELPQTKETKETPTAGQCKATTKAGTQCKRNASAGSDYCWQHQNSTKPEVKQKSSSSSYDNRTIYTGPRGGQYYINKNGNKTYIKKKK